MTGWARVLVALALALVSGVSGVATVHTQAATPEVVVFSGSRTAWVEVTLKAPIEFDLDAIFPSFTAAHAAVASAIHRYNTIRRHWSLDLHTPHAVFYRAA